MITTYQSQRCVLIAGLLTLALVAATSSIAFAQITAATLSGMVKDETGGVLPDVDLVVKNLDTGLTRSAVSDGNGYFTVPGLPPGRYEARASLQGTPRQGNCSLASR